MGLDIKCYPYGIYSENTYLVTDQASGFKAVIDPGWYDLKIKNEIQDGNQLKYLLLTHGHHDHFYCTGQFKEDYPSAEFAAPEKDLALIRKSPYDCPEPGLLLNDGDAVTLGETEFRVIATPGHTAGGICFLTDNEIFTGDTLFRLSVGRTDLESGDWSSLLQSIKERLYTLDDDLIVYPGHGMATTIGFEKKANPFV